MSEVVSKVVRENKISGAVIAAGENSGKGRSQSMIYSKEPSINCLNSINFYFLFKSASSMPQQITHAFTATNLPTLISYTAIASEVQSNFPKTGGPQTLLRSSNSNSSSEEGELSPLSLSLSSPWKNLPQDPASESSTEVDSPSSFQCYDIMISASMTIPTPTSTKILIPIQTPILPTIPPLPRL